MTREAGFTLTETLVAVALLAMIAVAATPAVRGAVTANVRLTEAAGEAEAHLRAEQVLRDLLGAAVRADFAEEAAFSGGPGGFSFLARPGGGAPLSVRVSAAESGLVLNAVPWPGGEAMSEALTGPDASLAVLYFGDPQGLGAPRWFDTWPGPAPPRLVVVDMAPGPDGAVRRMEIAVGAGADLACDYDSGLQACREGA
jgi:prepilin-type N-terminal cleavage/methylation domain-containing protein